MSLINEALKKAQTKTEPRPTVAPQYPSAPLTPSIPKKLPFSQMLILVIVAFVFGGLVLGLVITQRQAASTPPTSVSTPKAQETKPSSTNPVAQIPTTTATQTTPLTNATQPPPPPLPPPKTEIITSSHPTDDPSIKPRTKWKISGTSTPKNAERIAFINDEVVREGDEIDGATVISIRFNGVVLKINGEEQFFRVKQQ